MAATAEDPQPPPTSHVTRTVLFIDCVGNEPLCIYGVPMQGEQSYAAVKDMVTKAALPGQVLFSCAPFSPEPFFSSLIALRCPSPTPVVCQHASS